MLLGRGKQKPFEKLGCTQLFTSEFDPGGCFLHKFDHLALETASLAESIRVLIEVAEVNRVTQPQGAAGDLAAASDQIEKGGFAAAVGADDPDSILGAEAVGEIPQQ